MVSTSLLTPASAVVRRWHMVAAVIALIALCVVVAPRTASAQVGGTGPAGVSAGKGTVFAGSMISYRNVVSAISLDKTSEPTWNPYYAMTLLFAPRVKLSKRLSLSGMIIATQELTQSDWTNQAGEATLSDTFLTVNYRIGGAKGFGLSASGQVRLPTSKASQARTLLVGGLAGFVGSWGTGFSVAGFKQRVSLALIGRYGFFANRYTTGSLDTPWLEGCADLMGGCSRFSHSGARNPESRWQGIGALTWMPHSRLSIAVQFGLFYDTLYDLGTTTTQHGVSVAADSTDPDARGIVFYVVSANFRVNKSLSLAFGSETASLQLAPDSTKRTPFFNRNTTLFFAVRIFPDALISSLRGS
ncbi:MAG: hypothetical protein KC502_15125 [Myxococcales bacterium]|nr:hypothetical protein [Myxococcales bacterium]